MLKGRLLGYRRTWTPFLAAKYEIPDGTSRGCRVGGWGLGSSVIRGTRHRTSETPCPRVGDGTLAVID